jgi:hypothetical protein
VQRSGAIINISSVAARENSYPLVTYKATKAAMIAFTEQLALQNASYGIRANCILPGLMDTPMAVDTRARASNRSRAEVAAEQNRAAEGARIVGFPCAVSYLCVFSAGEAEGNNRASCGGPAAIGERLAVVIGHDLVGFCHQVAPFKHDVQVAVAVELEEEIFGLAAFVVGMASSADGAPCVPDMARGRLAV